MRDRNGLGGRQPGGPGSPGEQLLADVRSRVPVQRRRREVPYIVLGLAMTMLGALAAVLFVTRSSERIPVLVITRDVPAGQALTAADLRVEPVLAGGTVRVVRQTEAGSVVGRAAAVPLRAGRLLAPDDVGPLAWPPPGSVVVAAAVAPGAYPPELVTGMHVLVASGPGPVPAAGAAAQAGPGEDGLFGAPEAVVVGVKPNPAGTGGLVVSLQLSREGAGRVAGTAPGQLHLVIVPSPVAAGVGG